MRKRRSVLIRNTDSKVEMDGLGRSAKPSFM
jgi:hypothetical protein